MELKISEYAKVIAENVKLDEYGEANRWDIIELAIQIGKDNGLYDSNDEENLYWDNLDRDKCYSKAHEIVG